MKNRMYFFTGTGNSLKVAKDIAGALEDCEIMAIRKGMDMKIPVGYQRIGFVFPVYFFGLPDMVAEFVRQADLSKENAIYYFAVATPGGISGKPIAQMKKLFFEKGLNLHYSRKIRMPANYVANYNMSGILIKPPLRSYKKRIHKIIPDIKAMNTNDGENYSQRIENIYNNAIYGVHEKDVNFNVNDDCIACEICQNVCPAANISIHEGRPVYHHQCQLCMACIQHCPKKAINYGEKTKKRKRYTHPDIGYTEISKYYGHSQSNNNR
jgi:ferredoxin